MPGGPLLGQVLIASGWITWKGLSAQVQDISQCYSSRGVIPVEISPKSLPPFGECNLTLPVSCKLIEASVAWGPLGHFELSTSTQRGSWWALEITHSTIPLQFSFPRSTAGAPFREEPHNIAQVADSPVLLPNFTDVSVGSDSITIHKALTTAIIKV